VRKDEWRQRASERAQGRPLGNAEPSTSLINSMAAPIEISVKLDPRHTHTLAHTHTVPSLGTSITTNWLKRKGSGDCGEEAAGFLDESPEIWYDRVLHRGETSIGRMRSPETICDWFLRDGLAFNELPSLAAPHDQYRMSL
jgi:hypothetical protein